LQPVILSAAERRISLRCTSFLGHILCFDRLTASAPLESEICNLESRPGVR